MHARQWRAILCIHPTVGLVPRVVARVLFLFNHDAPHQVAHLAGVAAATARLHKQLECTVAYASDRIRKQIEQIIGTEVLNSLIFVPLNISGWRSNIAAALDRILPATRLLRLRSNLALFEATDVVVSTERTCLRTKRLIPDKKQPLYAKIPHGAGDRSVAYHPDYRRFDRVLVAGRKVVDQLVAHGVADEKIAIIGYPKFETVDLQSKPDFFANGRPTFLYNPHFDPKLSSWYDAGPDLLRWFASDQGQAYNLIFAPHVMLFRKQFHFSLEYRTLRARPDVPDEALAADNILVDTDGPRLFDMSYTLGSDAYIGDVSSQVYEFLVRPRPVFFLDCRTTARASDDAWHHFWQAGPVMRSVDKLTALLPHHANVGEHYAKEQRSLVHYTFDLSDVPASERAANEIARWLEHG